MKNNRHNDLNDKKLVSLDIVVVNREPHSNNELAIRNYTDDELDKNTVLRFNQTLQNYLKVSVGDDSYKPNKYDKMKTTDTTIIKSGNSGGYLLENWNI